jgi:hypothetical protein
MKTNLREIACGYLLRIHLAQDKGEWRPIMNMVIILGILCYVKKFLSS